MQPMLLSRPIRGGGMEFGLMVQKNHTDRIWYPLDNAAKIFPAVSDRRNTNVYRIYCELYEKVDPALLQQALDGTTRLFPTFQVIIRKGFFWYFLERTDQKAVVKEEDTIPCSQIFYPGMKKLLYKISWYNNRINLEAFHVLADGGGAIDFIRTLVYKYILLQYRHQIPSVPPLGGAKPPSQAVEDSFRKHYEKGRGDSLTAKKALQLSGPVLPVGNIRILEAEMPVSEIVGAAKAHGATLTGYLTALLIYTMHKHAVPKRKSKLPICVKVPVDLRRRFDSESARNFFSVVDISYTFEGGEGFERVLEEVSRQLKEKTSNEALERRINYTMAMENSVFNKFVPLFIKNPVMKIAYQMADRSGTAAISNVGNVDMPEEFDRYIRRFGVLLNPTRTSRIKIGILSYNGKMMLNMISNIPQTKVQREFFRALTAQGIEIIITGNEEDDYEIL